MSNIYVTQNKETILDDVEKVEHYLVTTIVTRTIGIPKEVFVHSTQTNEFQYVATIYDIKKWPHSLTEAQELHSDYYLTDQVTVIFRYAETANAAAEHHLQRLRNLAREWDSNSPFIPSTQYLVIEGETSNV
jgi:hypothetical protein